MQVQTTTNYAMFKPVHGNRTKNQLHIKQLTKSMKEKLLFTVIIVNEKFEIIDGQHRFAVISDLKLPLYYVVMEGYGLNEVHILNQNAKVWRYEDYLQGYCDLGLPHYIKYNEFRNKYNIGYTETYALLTGSHSNSQIMREIFFSGNFKVIDLNGAINTADKLNFLLNYYAGAKRRCFVYSIIKLLKNANFNFEDFIKKLQLQPTSLVDCVTVDSYVELIENIYNYKRREKINLRF